MTLVLACLFSPQLALRLLISFPVSIVSRFVVPAVFLLISAAGQSRKWIIIMYCYREVLTRYDTDQDFVDVHKLTKEQTEKLSSHLLLLPVSTM